MTPTEVGIAINVAVTLAGWSYVIGSLGAKVKRNGEDIQTIFLSREKDKEDIGRKLGSVEGKQEQAHGRLRETMNNHETRLTRIEAKANGVKSVA